MTEPKVHRRPGGSPAAVNEDAVGQGHGCDVHFSSSDDCADRTLSVDSTAHDMAGISRDPWQRHLDWAQAVRLLTKIRQFAKRRPLTLQQQELLRLAQEIADQGFSRGKAQSTQVLSTLVQQLVEELELSGD